MTAINPAIPEPIRTICTSENAALLKATVQYIREIGEVPYGCDVEAAISVATSAEVYLNQPDLFDRFQHFTNSLAYIVEGYPPGPLEKSTFHHPLSMLEAMCEATRRLMKNSSLSERDRQGMQKNIIDPISRVLNELMAADQHCIERWVEEGELEEMGLWIGKVIREKNWNDVPYAFTVTGNPGFTMLMKLVAEELAQKGMLAPGVAMDEAWSVADSIVWRCVRKAADHIARANGESLSLAP